MTDRPATTQVPSVKYRESLSQNETRSSVLRSEKLRLRRKTVINARGGDGRLLLEFGKMGGNARVGWL